MIEFKEFKIADLFTKKTVKGFSKVKEKVVYTKDGYHVFGQNIKYQFPQKVLLDSKFLFEVNPNKPIIGYASSTGSVGMISESFYRSGNNGAFQALIPKFDNYNYRHMLYLLACLRKLFSSKNYTTNINNVPEWIVKLPITSTTGKIDFQYMEDRVKALEQDRVKALDNYLTVTGLDNYELTDSDRKVLSYKPKFSEFKIEDIFKIHKGKRLTKANQIEGNTLFVGSTALNHGETARIGQNPIFKANTITVCYNGSVGETFYQDEPYWASDDINVLTLKDFKLNAEIAEYLCAVLKKAGKKYGYTYKWNVSRMKKSIISLPVTTNKVVDFKYMENYIKAVQKLTIKNVVKYKDEVINKTKEVINIKKF
ncbi:MAG: hypothetical protein HDR41_02260 [Lactobacillus sp.]|nr:hypothetical protein [Lactobacillus sp.]